MSEQHSATSYVSGCLTMQMRRSGHQSIVQYFFHGLSVAVTQLNSLSARHSNVLFRLSSPSITKSSLQDRIVSLIFSVFKNCML